MLSFNYINVYCHICGKICSNYIKPKPQEECLKIIKEWLECPYCVDCLKEHKLKGNRDNELINKISDAHTKRTGHVNKIGSVKKVVTELFSDIKYILKEHIK